MTTSVIAYLVRRIDFDNMENRDGYVALYLSKAEAEDEASRLRVEAPPTYKGWNGRHFPEFDVQQLP